MSSADSEILQQLQSQVAQMVNFLEPGHHCPDSWSLRDLIARERARTTALRDALDRLRLEATHFRDNGVGAQFLTTAIEAATLAITEAGTPTTARSGRDET